MQAEIFIDGKSVGTLNPANIEVEVERKDVTNGRGHKLYSYVVNKSYVARLENVQFSKDFFKLHTPDRFYKLVGTGWKLSKGKRMPKTKRLLKKYKKKYTYTIEMDNCILR
jgi:hypothetical protein